MATITDPSGSPVIVYNRSGKTVVSVTANGTSSGAAAVIPSIVAKYTVVLVAADPQGMPNGAVMLPSNPEIGDIVKVCVMPNSAGAGPLVSVYAPGTTQFAITGSGSAGPVHVGAPSQEFSYLSPSLWFI